MIAIKQKQTDPFLCHSFVFVYFLCVCMIVLLYVTPSFFPSFFFLNKAKKFCVYDDAMLLMIQYTSSYTGPMIYR